MTFYAKYMLGNLTNINVGNESWVTHLGEILRCGSRMGKLQGGSCGR